MKVLFAVSNEKISEAIIKRYQKDYKEIISYKNVYYFNAILKEIQRDKSYDRIVISEDLEPFANNDYDAIDKFLFEKLDNISDEAIGSEGGDTPIILICSDRRAKSEQLLVKLFGIGVYNAILGTDRSIDQVCQLIRKPRNKKEAKIYYKIDSEDVSYQVESEDSVSEVEIQNILMHYKKLGKDEDAYVNSFNNIASQYTDTQLKLIIKLLPLNVKAVLEVKSPKYQSLVAFSGNNSGSSAQRVNTNNQKQDKKEKFKINFIENQQNKDKEVKQVIVPSAVDTAHVKKLGRKPEKNVHVQQEQVMEQYKQQYNETPIQEQIQQPQNVQPLMKEEQQQYVQQPIKQQLQQVKPQIQPEPIEEVMEQIPIQEYDQTRIQEPEILSLEDFDDEPDVPQETVQVIKEAPVQEKITEPVIEPITELQSTEQVQPDMPRRRGRPRKVDTTPVQDVPEQPKRKRGRPRKVTVEQQQEVEQIQENMLPGFDDEDIDNILNPQNNMNKDSNVLPGFEDIEEDNIDAMLPGVDDVAEDDGMLPGFEDDILGIENSSATNEEDDGEDEEDFWNNNVQDVTQQEPDIGQYQQPQYNETLVQQPVQQTTQSDFVQPNNMQQTTQEPIIETGMPDYSNQYNQTYQEPNTRNVVETNVAMQNSNVESLTKDKKVVAFVGTSKNGTSFIVNNLAQIFSDMGINTAILDTTQNKNSYYIYTKNEENLRTIAYSCMEKIAQGIPDGIKVTKNLTVYTSLPTLKKDEDCQAIISNLTKNYSLVLIDCDFDTPLEYFAAAQEIYLVQSMDILTIQPLTSFLRELKAKGILQQEKFKIIINKVLKVRSLDAKIITGGISYYNDPSMSIIIQLFDKDKMKPLALSFDQEVYSKYLDGLVECKISANGYSKSFMAELKQIANSVYPLLDKKYVPRQIFSNSMNNTLEQMKGKF